MVTHFAQASMVENGQRTCSSLLLEAPIPTPTPMPTPTTLPIASTKRDSYKDLSDLGSVHGENGVYSFLLQNYVEAIDELTKAIDYTPDESALYESVLYYYRGLAKLNLGQNGLWDFNQSIRLDPLNSIGYYGRSRHYLDFENDPHRALQDITEAIRLKPDFNVADLQRGNVNSKLGQHDEAKADKDKACLLANEFC